MLNGDNEMMILRNGEEKRARGPIRLHLRDMGEIKKSIARIARRVLDDPDADVSRYRCAGYLIGVLLQAQRIDFEDRLIKLEEMANDEKSSR